jgi:hypothetical protein
MAEQAERNSHNDISYETPPLKETEPGVPDSGALKFTIGAALALPDQPNKRPHGSGPKGRGGCVLRNLDAALTH